MRCLLLFVVALATSLQGDRSPKEHTPREQFEALLKQYPGSLKTYLNKLSQFPGAVMPFVPTGSDGSGPVKALMSADRCIGIELSFEGEDEDS